jgi:hypothetical protein
MGALMRTMNLMEESKYFMGCENVRKYLQVFYKYVGEEEEYEEFENSVLDVAVSFQL